MSWPEILAIVFGGGGLLSGLWGWLSSRRMNEAQAKAMEAQAKATEAEGHGGIAAWAESVIKQAKELTDQHKDNADFWKKRTIEAEEYAKEIRAMNRAFRKENGELKDKNHCLEMENGEFRHKLDFAEWQKCERKCTNRLPPRDEQYDGYLPEIEDSTPETSTKHIRPKSNKTPRL